MPLEFFEVLVLFGRVVSFEVGFDPIWVIVLANADVHNLVFSQQLRVVFLHMFLVMLNDLPLLLIKLNQLLV